MVARVYGSADEAVSDIPSGASVLIGGFVSAGSPSNLILALRRQGASGLTAIANNIGLGDKLDVLAESGELRAVHATHSESDHGQTAPPHAGTEAPHREG